MPDLDFSWMDKLSGRSKEKTEQPRPEDALTERGYTLLEGAELPFREEPETDPGTAESLTRTPEEAVSPTAPPADLPVSSGDEEKVEICQMFSNADSWQFYFWFHCGRVELIENLRYYRDTGSIYAHFYLLPKAKEKS